MSRETVSKITDQVLEEMTAWMNRPLDEVYPVLFIDAIVVKVRDGQVRNKPIYVVIGSPWTVNATSLACGPVTGRKAQSSGCRCSPS